jgi:preprotein translocase subunit SecA
LAFIRTIQSNVKTKADFKYFWSLVEKVNALEASCEALTNEQLRVKTDEFRERIDEYIRKNDPSSKDEELRLAEKAMDEILPEAFAAVRESSKRFHEENQRHFDVQLIGGIVLHQGRIAEMKTGEGKTLAATLAIYLNALSGRGVHVVTVNDYLAQRDANWMGPIYENLGLTVAALQNGQDSKTRKECYEADIIYGTNSEFGFDYLRDNMVTEAERRVQKELNYAIVDEVDSILIDEARTPLIISGTAERSNELYRTFATIIPRLKEKKSETDAGDYEVVEKEHNATFTDDGIKRVEKMLGVDKLFDPTNTLLSHHALVALKAHTLYKRDVSYVIKEGKVIIVDEFTGRLMYGRRYSEGLHQAIEAKEHVRIENESQTMATITIQNYYRLYRKLAGMTGTAKTEEEEFREIYNMDVVVIPTNEPMIRDDLPDQIYKSKDAKFDAVLNDIEERHNKGQPILVGTIAIETSEHVSNLLRAKGIEHNVLNAKNHFREAEIIKDAGQQAAVTIATNMAGRGTDIKLGPGVVDLGGLHIVGTERHDSRRIDNQLRGRSGRQGDPGSSRFYLSLEDDLMRIFGPERIRSAMNMLGLPEDTPIEHKWITSAIEKAQRKVEAHNFEIRKHVLKYDDVMEKQRSSIYRERNRILEGENINDEIAQWRDEVIEHFVNVYMSPNISRAEHRPVDFLNACKTVFPIGDTIQPEDISDMTVEQLTGIVSEKAHELYHAKEEEIGTEDMRKLERFVALNIIDRIWVDHLYALDGLRAGIGLRAYAQVDPLVAYTKESFLMFKELWAAIKEQTIRMIFAARVVKEEKSVYQNLSESHGDQPAKKVPRKVEKKVGRNDPCPCGSGKKYKKCCGAPVKK